VAGTPPEPLFYDGTASDPSVEDERIEEGLGNLLNTLYFYRIVSNPSVEDERIEEGLDNLLHLHTIL
jgi:hypothetical protein